MSILMGGVEGGGDRGIEMKNGQETYNVKLGIHEWKCYPEYKDSGVKWIGIIPKEWYAKPLKQVTEFVSRGNGPDYVDQSSIQVINQACIHWDGLNFENLKYQRETNVSEWKGLLQKGDLLINSTGTGTLGRASILDHDGTFIADGHVTIVRPVENSISTNYLFYLIQTPIYQGFIYSALVSGSTNQIELSREGLRTTSVIVPSFTEQKLIGVFLDRETSKIDTLIQKKQRFIELLEEKRSALISRAVTKGLDPYVKVRDSGVEWIGEIPENWEIKPFRRVCSVNQGLQIAQSERFYEPEDTRLEYITIKSIHNRNSTKEYIENPPKSVICHPNDVLLARTGATGEVITDQEGVFHNNFFLIKYDLKKVYRDFLVYYLKNKSIKSYILLLAGTTTIPDLNHSEFLGTPFLSPPFPEQQFIVNFLDRETEKIDTLINKISAQIEKLKEYRTALISAAVTGKIDVREEVA